MTDQTSRKLSTRPASAARFANPRSNLVALITCLAVLLAATTSFAASGTWTNASGGTWSDTANWSSGTVADGAGNTADFNTLDPTAITTVTLDSARTLGTLLFGDTDTNTTPAGWVLNNGGVAGNTLNATNITVNSIFTTTTATIFNSTNDAIISAVVTGSGFTKSGAGTLTLQGANTMGPIRVDQGLIGIGSASCLGSQKVVYNGGGVIANAGFTITTTNEVLTTGHVYAPAANYDNFNGRWSGAGTMYIHNTSSRLTLGGTSGSTALLQSFTGTIDMADSAGGLLRIGMGSGSLYDCSAITFNLSTNGYLAPRIQAANGTFRIGSLSGGSNSRCASSENSGGLPTNLEVGGLNTSTLFEGRFMDYTGGRTGNLRKVGSGTLTLAHNGHTYSGTTTINQGALALTNTAALNSTPSITVAAGAIFDVSGLLAAWSPGTTQVLAGVGAVVGNVSAVNGIISPGVSGLGTLTFSNNLAMSGLSVTTNIFQITGSGTNDTIYVGGDLSLSDTIVVQLVPTGPSIPNGTNVLYKWVGTLTGDTNNLALVYPAQPGNVELQTDLGAKEIRLVVTGVAGPANLTWKGDGAANNWDLTTTNWLDGVTSSLFKNGDTATFNDSGSNNVPVNLATDVNPAGVLVNAAADYTFSSTGAFGIIGTSSLVKSNAGKLTVINNNSYSGGTIVAGGVVQVGDGVSSSGSLGSGSVTNNSTLIFNRPDDFTGNALAGSGSVIQIGAGTVSLNAANNHAGGTVASNGTVAVGNNSALGTGLATLAGGTLSFPAARTIVNPVHVASSSTLTFGTTGNSAVLLNSNLTGQAGTTLTVTPPGGSSANTRLRLGSGITNSFTYDGNIDLNGLFTFADYNSGGTHQFNGVISGAGILGRRSTTAGIAGTTILTGDNTYSGGTVHADGAIGLGLDSTGSPTVASGPLGTGALVFDETAVAPKRVFAYGGAHTVGNAINWPVAAAQDFVIEGTNKLTLAGDMNLNALTRTISTSNTADTVLSGVLSNGGLTKTGPGVLLLEGINTYSADTTVTGGTLGGTGTIAGAVIVQAGGNLAPGASIGILTVNGNLTLNGTFTAEVNSGASTNCDRVTGIATVNYGGALVISNLGPTLTASDTFQLFSATTYGAGSFAGITPTQPATGLYWDTSTLTNDGTLRITATPPVNPNPTNIISSVSGGNLTLSWPSDHLGWTLQTQTNSRSVGLVPATNAWFDVTGSTSVTNVVIPLNSTDPTVFYRLRLFLP